MLSTIHPLDIQSKIYALYDEKGKIIGTGTQEVCEVLMYIVAKAKDRPARHSEAVPRPNLRAAIAI